jgi:hypothetical protein
MKAVILVLLIATALCLVRPSVLAQAKLMSLADHITPCCQIFSASAAALQTP